MQWSEANEEGCTILSLKGEIDLQYSPMLRRVLKEKIDARCPALVVDFSGVEYIDSSGLATLVEYCRDVRGFSGAFALAGMTARIQTIFELVRLNELLAIYPTVSEARAALQGKS
jgi:anti-sigma B factor antagonist